MAFADEYQGNYSKYLIRLAWAVEIIAVIIGFTISIIVTISTLNQLNNETEVSFFEGFASMAVAGLPFVMIAIVELTKIPLTFAFMAVKNWFWRLLFLFFVIFLCTITFETMLNGFERNFSNLNRAIDMRKNTIEDVNTEIDLLDKKKQRITTLTEEELEAEIEESQFLIDEEYRISVARSSSRTDSQLAAIDDSFKPQLQADIERLLDKRDGYYEEWRIEREDIEARFASLLTDNIQGSASEKDRLIKELEALKAERQEKLDKANVFTRATVDQKYLALIASKERQISQITTGFLGSDAITKQATMQENLQNQIELTRQKFQRRIDDINRIIDSKEGEIMAKEQANADLRSRLTSGASGSRSKFMRIKVGKEKDLAAYEEEQREILSRVDEERAIIEEQIFRLRNDQRRIQTEINALINENQVYRMAMYAYGKKSAAEVDRKMVGFVAAIWFGSLALIAAVTGVMLSLAGFYLKRNLLRRAEEERLKAEEASASY